MRRLAVTAPSSAGCSSMRRTCAGCATVLACGGWERALAGVWLATLASAPITPAVVWPSGWAAGAGKDRSATTVTEPDPRRSSALLEIRSGSREGSSRAGAPCPALAGPAWPSCASSLPSGDASSRGSPVDPAGASAVGAMAIGRASVSPGAAALPAAAGDVVPGSACLPWAGGAVAVAALSGCVALVANAMASAAGSRGVIRSLASSGWGEPGPSPVAAEVDGSRAGAPMRAGIVAGALPWCPSAPSVARSGSRSRSGCPSPVPAAAGGASSSLLSSGESSPAVP